MALVVQLYGDGRTAERHDLGADATVRGPDRVPVDVLVADLSQTGCLFVTTEPLALDAVITIGIAGVGLREARIVRNQDVRFGCTFLTPLTDAELAAGLAESETVALFPLQHPGVPAEPALPVVAKLPRPLRLAAFSGLVAASWALVVVLARLI
jgi:hypothetical protein